MKPHQWFLSKKCMNKLLQGGLVFLEFYKKITRAVPNSNSTIGGQINTTFLVEFLLIVEFGEGGSQPVGRDPLERAVGHNL